ncbi:MAG TPA: hypothetical protein VIN58_08190 [Roseateles sp.]
MSFIVPLGLLVCSVLWLKGLKSIWARGLLLASFLGLTFVLIPSVRQDASYAHLAIYQQEAISFSAEVAADIERGDSETAKKKLRYFSKHQDWSIANDPETLRAFYKQVRSAGREGSPPTPEGVPSTAPK